ncbi:ComEC/Rec2 family competence protein [Clostridium perfringens]|uniref:ComEC/Rec2 family competence protein n=1 Tax=Clostridium perfringens TaxID=1502 RepID=UPI001ABA4CC0|nr:MBL fold metallo-hydrolase [Clostridium perfringens]
MFTLATSIFLYSTSYSIPNENFTVHYIDVGQGDSALIQSNGKNLLIDAGTPESTNSLVKYLKNLGIKKLDFIIATHPHADHIGGMESIIKKFDVDYFCAPKVTENTDIFKGMVTALKEKDININTLSKSKSLPIDLGENTKIEVYSPPNKEYENINNYSPILKIYYGETSFLFTGDAETEAEMEAVKSNENLKSDVLKVGHHGSTTSSTDSFLKEVSPKIAVISSGLDNSYGHPAKETLKKLSSYKTKVFRTDEDGTIILTSDGKSIKKHKN